MTGSVGAMVERLTIQEDAASTNTHGSRTPAVWTTVDTVDAEKIPLTGAERLEANRVGSSVQFKFRIWARADVTAKMRGVWTPNWPSGSAARVVDFHAIVPDPDDSSFLLIECSTHDASPIPDSGVTTPSWIQENWTQ